MTKIKMVPSIGQMNTGESGIHSVVRAYHKHLPVLGVEIVSPGDDNFDCLLVHAGTSGSYPAHTPVVSMLHGLYWTADYQSDTWEWKANETVIESIRNASVITVPSPWVGETIQRDVRVDPMVVPHGIDWLDWQHGRSDEGYAVSYAKNRDGADVCNSYMSTELARRCKDILFVATFSRDERLQNVKRTGVVPHEQMKRIVQGCSVFVSPAKETFGIAILEAMASGKPVLSANHGNGPVLVQHGVNGYLYDPQSIDDMEAGLRYCLKHKVKLGANSRQLARGWTWELACQRVTEAIGLATEAERTPATVGVVIPFYNKTEGELRRAIESARNQDSHYITSIVVVDDGSKDENIAGEVVRSFEQHDQNAHGANVVLVRQNNSGVANARNTGIGASRAKYICCLDADDAIEPAFIRSCVEALEQNRSVGIAYTRLRWIKPDGSTGVSEWPNQWRYDRAIEGQNQVPTCCVFRREMWQRLGGYRQRYAPGGAGEEDAEFWLRAGAYGFRAILASEAPLFVYSWMSGQVTGNKQHRMTDYRGWHPWVRDGQHPLASLATPKKFSHPVRQYDEPVVSVIIPVGPGHEEHLINALDSLEAQTFRKWEAVVVWDSPDGKSLMEIERAYPYIRVWATHPSVSIDGADQDDDYYVELPVGAGAARNLGVNIARGSLLLFLDADDWLYPQALEKMLLEWQRTGNAIYTDYVGIAQVSDPDNLAPGLRQRIYTTTREGQVIGHRSQDFDCHRAQRQPEIKPDLGIYHWCNITTLHPRDWFCDVGGFDESLRTWEDIDYFWRLARRGYCFQRLPEELMVYRFHTGGRREAGVPYPDDPESMARFRRLLEYLRDKYEKEGEPVGCGCSKNANTSTSPVSGGPSKVSANETVGDMADDDYVQALYMGPNKAHHPVRGAFTRRFYGYRHGGGQEKFLVHKKDIELQPHLFQVVERKVGVEVPRKEPAPLGEPVLVEGAKIEIADTRTTKEVGGGAPIEAPPLDLRAVVGDLYHGFVAAGITATDAIAMGLPGLQELLPGVPAARLQFIVMALEKERDRIGH